MPYWTQITFQDSNSTLMEHIIIFNDHSSIVLAVVISITLYTIVTSINNNSYNNFILENQIIESVWTIVPAVLLMIIAIPSINTLYLIEDISKPTLTLNSVGHQWYWSYHLPSITKEGDSFMSNNSNLLRLLSTSSAIQIPSHVEIRVLVTSQDVIHSWSIPSAGMNIDAAPGRLNQATITITQTGMLTGQCAEICGANHSFIPISIISL